MYKNRINGLKRAVIGVNISVFLMVLSPVVFAWKGEAAAFTTNNTLSNKSFQSVGFQQAYTVPPVVVVLPSTQGSDAATIRLRNVTTSGFENSPTEVYRRDGPHLAMNSAYIAIEPGVHVMSNGDVIVAGFIDSSHVQHGAGVTGVSSWDTVNFGYVFSSPPTIVATIQTMNNEQGESGRLPPFVSSVPWVTVAMDNITTSQFSLALERSQEAVGSVTQAERIGYIAMLNGSNGSFTDSQNNTVSYLAETTSAAVRGWSDGDTNHSFSVPFSAAPISVATKNSRNNPDGGWLRRSGNTTSTGIRLRVDEDDYADSERSLSATQAESAGILSFSRNFVADFPAGFTIDKSSRVISDPVNGQINPKAIPGAIVEYTLLVSNVGHDFSDADDFRITDALPANTSLLVDDAGGAGSGPIGFTEGTSPSMLDWDFSLLSDLNDSIAFSDNGSDYSYIPSPDGQGIDQAVTHIALEPGGIFSANPSQPPTASFTYRIQIH